MLIEQFENNGIHVVSANTDGVVCLFDKDLDDLYYEICGEWEYYVGNSDLGQLEFVDYRLFAQTSVNHYIAFKIDDNKPKTKGDFVSDFEIHKDRSARIIPLALQEYYKGNKDIETFIKNHTGIYDFCLGVKSKGGAKFIAFNPKDNSEIELQKVNRYYISNKGIHLLKRLKPLEKNKNKVSNQLDIFGDLDDGTRQQEVEAGWLSTVFNKYIEKDIKEYDINYTYYINRVLKIINNINGA